MAGRVAVISPDGEFGTVDETDAEAVARAGGRVLTKQEVAARQAEEQYQAQPTWKKVATVASMAGPLGYIPHVALRASGGQLPPELEAYTQGVSSGMTGGLASVGMKEAVEAVGGKDAGKAYAQTAKAVTEAHGGLHTAGQLAGFLGGAVAAPGTGALGKAIPGVGISALGGVAEQAAARGLAGVAARGAVGRALATGGELATRGAVEGALYAGAEQVSDAMLGDHELAAEKVFAAMGIGALGGAVGGFALGGAGSLATSGVKAVASKAQSAIGRALTKTEQTVATVGARADAAAAEARTLAKETADEAGRAVTAAGQRAEDAAKGAARGVVDDAVASGKAIAEVTGTKPAQELDAFKGAIDKLASTAEQKGMAYDQAWKAIGAGQGLQSTAFAKRAAKYLPNGTRDVGEVIMRKGILNVEDGWVAAARGGTPEQMLPKIAAQIETVGARIGEITAANPARVPVGDLEDAFDKVLGPLRKKAGFEAVVSGVEQYRASLYEKLGLADPLLPRSEVKGLKLLASVQDVLAQRKALDQLVYQEAKTLDPKGRVAALRELRTHLEGVVSDSLDKASGDVPGKLLAEYKALKKDYMALSIAAEAAEDSAARMSKGASLGLRDMLAGVAGGGGLTGTASAFGHKLIRERGNAAAAVLLHRMAEMGTLTKVIRSTEEAITRASKGLLAKPAPSRPPESFHSVPVRERAQRALQRIAEIQADPASYTERVTRATEPLHQTAPQLAGALTQRFTDFAAFMAARVPVKPDPDPFDPHPAPRLTDAQAHTLALYDWYAEKPIRFFEDAERGKITPEGVEVAKTMMPRAFAELQQRTAEGLTELLARGVAPPYAQRAKLGALLDFPAVPSQRPQHMRLLQSNVLGSAEAAKAPPPTAPGATAPKRPIPTKTQQSALDRLEGR